jgi:hypothetical protein
VSQVAGKTKKVRTSSFLNSVRGALSASSADQQEDVLEEVVGLVLDKYDALARSWDGGEAFKRQEGRVLRNTGYTKLAQSRAGRPTWPSLKFDVTNKKISGGVGATVTTDNPLFVWLDRGTRDQMISDPRKIVGISIRGTAPGSDSIYSTITNSEVSHVRSNTRISGIEARDWSKNFAAEVQREADARYPGYNVKVEVYG